MQREGKLSVPAVGKAFTVLEYIAHAKQPCTLRDIYEGVGIPKTTAFALMGTLSEIGVVTQLTAGGYYLPGARLYSLGVSARSALTRARFFRPRLEALRDELGLSVFFSLYDTGQQMVWEKIDGYEPVLFKAYPGEYKWLNTSSAGKAILAFLAQDELELVLARGLIKRTERSIATPESLIKHLADVRSQGYAIDDEEDEPGIFCLGAPVFLGERVLGAVSVSMLKSRLRQPEIAQYVAAIKRTAADLSTIADVKKSC